MTYPQPYGRAPGPHGPPAPYGPPAPHGQPSGQRKKPDALLFVALGAVALLVLCCGGGVGAHFWLQGQRHGGPGSASDSAAKPSGSAAKKPPLTNRAADQVLAVLPGQEDFPHGWKVNKAAADSADSEPDYDTQYSPSACEAPFATEDSTTLGSVEGSDDGQDGTGDGISVSISMWLKGSKASKLDSFVATCATFAITDTYRDGSEVDTYYLRDTRTDPPKANADGLLGFEKRGRWSYAYSDGRAAESGTYDPVDVYFADVRGLYVWFVCTNVNHIKDKCRAVFTDVVNKLDAL